MKINEPIVSAIQIHLNTQFPKAPLYHQVSGEIGTTRLMGSMLDCMPVFIIYCYDGIVYYLDNDNLECLGTHVDYGAPDLFEQLTNAVRRNLALYGTHDKHGTYDSRNSKPYKRRVRR